MMEVKSVEVEIPVPVENIPDTSAILTDAFFKKLGLNADVVVYVGTPNTQVGGGSSSVKEITMPYRLFYTAFSNVSRSLKSKKVEPVVATAKSSWSPFTGTDSKSESIEEPAPDTKQTDGKDYAFTDFLSNVSKTIVTNPTKVDDTKPILDISEVTDTVVKSIQVENKPVDREEITTLSDRIVTYMSEPKTDIPEEKPEEKKEESEEEPKEEAPKEEEPKEESLTKDIVHPPLEDKVSPITQFISIFSKPATESETEDITNTVHIKLTGKDIKEVSGKTEYSHYMDEYLLKREIDIMSKGLKKMVDTQYCVQYLVDGRYVILGAIEDKPQEDLNAPEKWKNIKNTEAYKKFVRYNIV